MKMKPNSWQRLLTVPITRTYEPARSTIEFDDRAGKLPVAIKAWFYPADNTGEEFRLFANFR